MGIHAHSAVTVMVLRFLMGLHGAVKMPLSYTLFVLVESEV